MSLKLRNDETIYEDNGKYHSRVNMPSSLVLDEERGELVMACLGRASKVGGNEDKVVNAKAVMALKSHSESERRRRERINGHLSVLRSLVPCTHKLDKAALLAEVINQVKLLKSNAIQRSKNIHIPSDTNEVTVELDKHNFFLGQLSIKASLSCEDRPDILNDLRQTILSLNVKITSANITTLGGRINNEFVLTYKGDSDNVKEMHMFMSSVRKALMSVLDRAALLEFDANKRRRVTPFESSSSSS